MYIMDEQRRELCLLVSRRASFESIDLESSRVGHRKFR
jgi:hypothetical protein